MAFIEKNREYQSILADKESALSSLESRQVDNLCFTFRIKGDYRFESGWAFVNVANVAGCAGETGV
jgi:hypothetical protein